MHLVFLNQYYPPDVAPTGVVLRDVAEELLARGHEVTIICSSGGYAGGRCKTSRHKTQDEDSPSPIHVRRIRATRFGRETFLGKVVDYGSYYLGVAWRLMFLDPRPDRIVALTTPPYLSVLARLISRFRGADHAHWVMDLYPDVMVAHGLLGERGSSHRLLAALARWGFGGSRCAGVVTLGPDMAERVDRIRNGGDGSAAIAAPASWVPLWGTGGKVGKATSLVDEAAGIPRSTSPTLPASELRRQRGWADDDVVVMYSGNMGLGHRFGEILAAARELSGGTVKSMTGRRVRFVFFGGGKRRGEVLDFVAGHPDSEVEVHDYAPAEMLAGHLQSADVHLVSLDQEWTGTMVPSKLQGIFEVGRPVIFIGSRFSSIGRWVLDSGGGWVVRPGNVTGLLGAIGEACDAELRNARGQAARAYGEIHFRCEVNAAHVAGLFESITIHKCPKV